MNPFAWEDLPGSVLDDSYELENLIRGVSHRALFTAHSLRGERQEPVSIQLFRREEGDRVDQIERRFKEAMFLDNPHLLRILDVGTTRGGELLYIASEKAEYGLSRFIENRPLPEADARELTEQVVSALDYLHSENFVFCNLSVDSVWRVGSSWKLADFSEMRVIGSGDRRDLRPALSRLAGAPPEAFEGVVDPAWDTWSLGALLRRVLTPDATHVEGSISLPRGRHLRASGLPAPFEAIARECLQPDPGSRPPLENIYALVASVPAAAVPVPEPSRTEPNHEPRFERLLERRVENRETEHAVAPDDVPAAAASAEQPRRPEYVFPPYRGFESEPAAGSPLSERFAGIWGRFRAQPAATRALLAFAAGILIVIMIAAMVSASNRRTASASTANIPVAAESDRARTANNDPASFGSGTKESPAVPYEEKAGRDEENVRAVFNRWLDAGRKRDAAGQADCYAPVVATYYNHHRVSRGEIQRDKQKQFANIGTVHRLDASNVQISQLNAGTAVILFDKTWDFGDRNKFTGSERAQLTMGKVDGKWKITGERELKIYRVHRGR